MKFLFAKNKVKHTIRQESQIVFVLFKNTKKENREKVGEKNYLENHIINIYYGTVALSSFIPRRRAY